jgi:hypothetical protein
MDYAMEKNAERADSITDTAATSQACYYVVADYEFSL